MSEDQLFVFLRQMCVVLVVARVLGEGFRFLGQPPIAGEILAGVLLGQTVFGQLWPEAFASLFPAAVEQRVMFETTAYIGVFLLLLVIGIEVDVVAAWKLRASALTIAVMGVLLPLLTGFAVSWLLYDRFNELPDGNQLYFSLFVAVGISITAITVVAKTLFDLNVVKSDMGLLLLAAMAINDLLGWGILAVIMGTAPSQANLQGGGQSFQDVAFVILGIVAFTGLCATWGRSLVTRCLRAFDRLGLPAPATPLSFVVGLGLLCGVVTHEIGIHPIFGFFVAGLMASDKAALSEHTRDVISQMVEAVFVPLFFAGIALHVDFAQHFDWAMVLVVTGLSIGAKFFGAWAGTVLARLPKADRLPIGIAHIPGGPMGVLLALVARQAQLIGEKMFVALVFAAVASSLLVGPALAWALRAHRRQTGVLRWFSREAMIPELRAQEPNDCIDELIDCLAELDASLPIAEIREIAQTRESTQTTGLGLGVAVPHARVPGLDQARVVFGRSRPGIAWNAVDDMPASLIFFILSPEDDADIQLSILRAIACGIENADQRALLLAAGDEETLWKQLGDCLLAADSRVA